MKRASTIQYSLCSYANYPVPLIVSLSWVVQNCFHSPLIDSAVYNNIRIHTSIIDRGRRQRIIRMLVILRKLT